MSFLGCSTNICDELDIHYSSFEHQYSIVEFIKTILLKFSEKSSKKQYESQLKQIQHSIQNLFPIVIDHLQVCNKIRDQQENFRTKINHSYQQIKKISDLFIRGSQTLDNCQKIFNSIETTIAQIKSKPMRIPLITAEGTYTSKINILQFNNQDQIIKSERILTSSSGYEISLIYETITDKLDKKRYLSVKYTVLQGEYDAILQWPMLFPLAFSLLDLTSKKNHLTHTITPLTQSECCFVKPTNEENEPIEIQKFCALDDLLRRNSDYVQDNSIYIQLSIDFTTAVEKYDFLCNKSQSESFKDRIQTEILP